ncbi:MAG: hypothetical protein ALECFALPRED_000350 [Alectoria fallacina]|uniref:Uncharacterized protein n=1 Tax=Alectoria fallacina TaxID=1903189 RepID=A0A8H3F496_9LECA|nr:MAG: hypothetical protein ALECFALPRED_000350 [Alectoria fallacina]
MNIWNGDRDAKLLPSLSLAEKPQIWSQVPNLDQVKYAREFEVKDPSDPETIYLEASNILPNIPIVSAIPGLIGGVAGGVASVASGILSGLFGSGS